MPPPPLPTKITSAAVATKAVATNSSSSSPTTQPATPTSDISNSPTPPAGRTIRITSSCNYTKPIIRLNLKKLNSKTVISATTASSSFAPITPVGHQAPKVQAASNYVSSPFPASTPADPDLSQVSLTSTSKQTNSPKTTQPVVSTIKSSNSAHSSSGSRYCSNISLPTDYGCGLVDEAGTTDEPDPDPDLRHRCRHTQPQQTRSPSLPHPPPLPTKQLNQTQELEMTCSVDGEDPFKKLGLKPYSPIWLPSRTPSFEMTRQRSYSPNPRHGMTIRPSPVHDGDDVIDKEDRDILGFDLHEPLKEEDKSNKNLITAAGKERQEPGSSRLYERFGSIKKRSSPLLPDHYDDLEDYDAEEVNFQIVDAKTTCMSTTKRPRRDHAQDQSQVPPPPFFPPNANNINTSKKHARPESADIVEDPGSTHHNGQSPSSPIWSDNNSSNHNHPYRQQLYGNRRLLSSQHHPHSHYQPHHHRHHSQQHETFQNNYPYNHHHHNHQTNRPYLSRPWTSYRRNNYQHPDGFHHTRVRSHPGNGGDGDEGNNWFQHERAFIGRRRGRGRGFGRGRGRGRGGYDNAEFYNRYHFPPRQGGSHGMNPFHQPQHQHHVGDESPMIDARPLEIVNGNATGTGTGTVSDHSSASPPPSSPPQRHVTDPRPPSSSSLSIASSSRTTLHTSPNLNHHIHASAQQNEKHSQANSSNNTEPSTPPQSLPTAPPSSAETKTTVAPFSKSMISTTTSLPYYFPSSSRTPSPPPPPQPTFISHHATSPHNSISASKSFSKSLSRSLSRSFSRSYSRSRSPSPATLASSAQTRLTRYAASEISSLAQKLTTEQTLRVQAQKQIRFLTQSLRDLEERNQLVEQNYEVLLARYSREVRE